jgi:hypothetical protein
MTGSLDWLTAVIVALLATYATKSYGFLAGQAQHAKRHFDTEIRQLARLRRNSLNMIQNPLQSLLDVFPSIPSDSAKRFCKAQDLVTTLVKNEKCFSSETGAAAFVEACAPDVVYDDCYSSTPFVGREVHHRSLASFVYNVL